MPETVILNPESKWDKQIDDNPSPDYGFSRKRADLRVRVKAAGGSPDSREVQNGGHSLSLSWLNRSYACVQRVMRIATEHEDDYFTIIDHDAKPRGAKSGRNYVVQLVGDMEPIQQGNGKWDLRDIRFDEFPGAPMLKYPSDWDNDAIWILSFTSRKQNAATSGAWTQSEYALEDGAFLPTMDIPGDAGAWACMEYRGYGFKVEMITGRGYGQVEILLDGVLQASRNEDASLASTTVDLYRDAGDIPETVFVREDVPLDLHRVKIRSLGTANVAATAAGYRLTRLQVMR